MDCRIGLLIAATSRTMSSVAGADLDTDETGSARYKEGREWRRGHQEQVDVNSRGERHHFNGGPRHAYSCDHGYERLDIPPCHYPPPCERQVWYPDSPRSAAAYRRLPTRSSPRAWVIRHPSDQPDRVPAHVYEPSQPDDVYLSGTGGLVRAILD